MSQSEMFPLDAEEEVVDNAAEQVAQLDAEQEELTPAGEVEALLRGDDKPVAAAAPATPEAAPVVEETFVSEAVGNAVMEALVESVAEAVVATDVPVAVEEVAIEEPVAEEVAVEETFVAEAVGHAVVDAVVESVTEAVVAVEVPVAAEVPVPVAETVFEEPAPVKEEPVVIEEAAVEEVVAVEETVAEETVVVEEEPAAPAEPANGFAAIGLNKSLVSALDAAGYTTPTPIQAGTIPHILEGRDVLGQAQTGTGKTAAFALPLLQRINLSQKKPQVLVLAPTRELAIQVGKSFEKYATDMRGLRVVPIYGGQDYQVQFRELNRGAHIVVGTPGRVMDHMRRGSVDVSELKCLVLDEADEMLRMGFAEDVDWVLTQAPEQRQMALFSATMPGPIRAIANKHLKNPSQVTIKQKAATADTINQRYFVATPHQKQAALARILEAESTDGVLIFVKMRSTTEPLAEFLAQAGLKTAALNGDIAQKQRERIVERLRSGKVDVIVATDVAARGLDVQRISHVVNYDLPHDSESYVHRIGRTGRAGRSGEAILFVHPRERYQLQRLEKATRQTIEPMSLPSNRDINKQRVARFHQQITDTMAHDEMDTFRSIVTQYQRQNEDVTLESIAAALAVLVNKEQPLLAQENLKQASFAADSRRGGDKRYGSNKREYGKKREYGSRDNGPKSGGYHNDEGMETYRIEVGRNHSVQPGNIVGAIANEAGLGNGKIGKIKIFDRFSMVDLPQGLTSDVMTLLGNVSVAGQKLRISKAGGGRPQSGNSYSGKPYSGKPKSGSGKPYAGKKSYSGKSQSHSNDAQEQGVGQAETGESRPKTGTRFQGSNRALNRSSFKKNDGGGKTVVKNNRFKSRRRKGSTEA